LGLGIGEEEVEWLVDYCTLKESHIDDGSTVIFADRTEYDEGEGVPPPEELEGFLLKAGPGTMRFGGSGLKRRYFRTDEVATDKNDEQRKGDCFSDCFLFFFFFFLRIESITINTEKMRIPLESLC
jgi:hypothetical protein